jgi:hypothetical protein
MRCFIASVALSCFCVSAVAQTIAADEALLTKTRALYDAPFRRNLVSFDCAVQFDWKKHFVDFLGAVPPAAVPTAERLQTVEHRVFIDRSGAVVSAIPKAPDLTRVAHAPELEQALNAMVSGGLNAWLPFSTNVILPVGPTKFNIQKIDPGYKLVMNGPGVAATLLLDKDMRLTSVVSTLPQHMRFTTEFTVGPDGFLLGSLKTGDTSDAEIREATFAFTYQTVQGFQLPGVVTVTPSTSESWQYALTNCKAMTGVTLKVGPPSPNPSPTSTPSPDSILIPQ